jgi:hypothetical protein
MSRFSFWPRHVVLVTVSLASLLVVGCKQDIGERCEQDSDCHSGLCSQTGASAQGGICEDTLPTGSFDAATPSDAASGAADARDAGADTGPDARSDAAADVASDGHAAEVSEDAVDGALESHVEAASDLGASTTEAGSEAGSEAGALDAPSGG